MAKMAEHLEQIRKRRRILVGMGRVGVEESSAVGAELFDNLLRGDRSLRDHLIRALEGLGLRVGAEVLRNALPYQDQRKHDRERKQNPERGAREIEPEVADRLGRAAREAPDDCDCHRDSRRSRNEVVERQPCHLGQVAHRAFAAVGLPVGIGGETGGGVERQHRRDARQALRIQRQVPLQPLQRVERQHPDKAEEQHVDRVFDPGHFVCGLDATKPIDEAFNRLEHRVKQGMLPVEDARHVGAERHRDGEHQEEIQAHLGQSIANHRVVELFRIRSEVLGK